MGELIVLDGCTFFISDETGDTNSDPHEGFFIEDVRHLSQWELLVDGEPIDVLTVTPREIEGKRIRLRGLRVHGQRFDAPR